jgi:hypothetical protein
MINSMADYEEACQELLCRETWLRRLQKEHPAAGEGLTKASIRKMIARLHEELGAFEASLKLAETRSK